MIARQHLSRMRRALQQRLPVAAGMLTLTVLLAATILLPTTVTEALRDSAFDLVLAGDQPLRSQGTTCYERSVMKARSAESLAGG